MREIFLIASSVLLSGWLGYHGMRAVMRRVKCGSWLGYYLVPLMVWASTAQAGNIIGPAGQWAFYSQGGGTYWDDPSSNTAVIRWDFGSAGGGTAWTNDSTDYGLWLIPHSGTVSQVAVGTDSFARVQYAGKYNEASSLRSHCEWYTEIARYFTVSAWLNATSKPAQDYAMAVSTYDNSPAGYFISFDLTRTNYYAFLTRLLGPDITLNTTTPWPLNSWVLVTLTYNGDSGVASLYANSTLLVTSNGQDNLVLENSHRITLGKQAVGGDRYFPGFIGPTRVYYSLIDSNACLSAQSVSNLYTKTLMPNGNTSRAVSFPHVWTDRFLSYRLLTSHFTETNAAGCFTPEDGPGVFSNMLGVTSSAYTNAFGTNGFVHFNGTNYLIDYTLPTSSLKNSTQGAVGVWFRVSQMNVLSTLWCISNEKSAAFSQIGMRLAGSGASIDIFCYQDSSPVWVDTATLAATITTGVWHHVVLAESGSTNNGLTACGGLWLDGVNIPTAATMRQQWFKYILTDAATDADSWTFGVQRYNGASYYPFQGDIAGFQIYTNYCGSPQWHADWNNTFPTNSFEVP